MTEQIDIKADIEKIAASVRKRRLEVPAIFFLESHRPMFSLASHAATVLMPAVSMFVPTAKIAAFQRILASSEAVEELISSLEKPQVQGTS